MNRNDELAAARERSRPREVAAATVSREAWDKAKEEGKNPVTRPAEPKSLDERRHIDADIIFKDGMMRKSLWEKPVSEGGLTDGNKHSLANRIGDALAASQDRASIPVAIDHEGKRKTAIYKVGEQSQMVINGKEAETLNGFAHAVAALNSDAYQRHVATHMGMYTEVPKVSKEEWHRRSQVDGYGTLLKTDEHFRAGRAINQALSGMDEIEGLEADRQSKS